MISGSKAQAGTASLPGNCKQILVVLNNRWTDFHAIMICFERKGEKWKEEFRFNVVLGAAGLGWGDGRWSEPENGGFVKKEGDNRSPAGLFSLGKAFGYSSPAMLTWLKWPYLEARDTLFCVDDSGSAYYNKLVSADTVRTDWKSFEYIHRKDEAYKWGIFVNHNPHSIPGSGSCIFLHLWSGKDSPTVGCTAMPEENMIPLLHWLDSSKNPLLIQLPRLEYIIYATAHKDWDWPEIQH